MIKIFMINALLRIVFIICITLAAIHFEKASLLWWYILPALMELEFKAKSND